jgi:hypothetical protein
MARERSTEDLQRLAVGKLAYAFMLPLSLFISATLTLIRSPATDRLMGVCFWLGFVVAALVLRKLIMDSAHRDIDELHRRYRS